MIPKAPFKNVLVVPHCFAGTEIVADPYCENDRIYFIDGNGKVHVLKHVGVIQEDATIKPGDYRWAPKP